MTIQPNITIQHCYITTCQKNLHCLIKLYVVTSYHKATRHNWPTLINVYALLDIASMTSLDRSISISNLQNGKWGFYILRFSIYVLPFTHKMDASLKSKSDYVLFCCNHLDYFAIAAWRVDWLEIWQVSRQE